MPRKSLSIDILLRDAIIKNVAMGLTYKDASEKEGVTARAVRKWMKRGREEHERLTGQDEEDEGGTKKRKPRPRQSEASYHDFYLLMEKAKAGAKGKVMAAWYKSATESTIVRETTIVQTINPRTKEVLSEVIKDVTRDVHPDWRAQQAIMQHRYGMIPTTRITFDMESMTDEELERIANGDEPLDVIQDRLSATGGGDA